MHRFRPDRRTRRVNVVMIICFNQCHPIRSKALNSGFKTHHMHGVPYKLQLSASSTRSKAHQEERERKSADVNAITPDMGWWVCHISF